MYPYWNTWHTWNHYLPQQHYRIYDDQMTQYLKPYLPVSPIPPFSAPPVHFPTPVPTHTPTPIPTQQLELILYRIAAQQRWINFYQGLLANTSDPGRRREIEERLIAHINELSSLQSQIRITP